MKFAIGSEHRDYFRINRKIEFDDLLNQQQLLDLNQGIEAALAKRLNLPLHKVSGQPPHVLFSEGRDLWRSDDKVRRIVLSHTLAEIASELLEQKQIRIGYDQLFPESRHLFAAFTVSDTYSGYIKQKHNLMELSSLSRMTCGLNLCLSGAGLESETPSLFPIKRGNGIFFDPELPIDFKELQERPGHRYLMIVYTPMTSHFLNNPKDPQTHTLKHLGYGFGDALTDKLNPLLVRS